MFEWWRQLNGAKKTIASLSAALVALGFGYNLYHTYDELPAVARANTAAIDTLARQQAAMEALHAVLNEKLDRVICILVLEDGEDPLICEMGN